MNEPTATQQYFQMFAGRAPDTSLLPHGVIAVAIVVCVLAVVWLLCEL